jgi:hypothetical protein
MLVISNHVNTINMLIPIDAILRVNVAWIKNVKDLEKILNETDKIIMIDYPMGRFKPPIPKISIEDTLFIVNKCPKVHYFAISNSELSIIMMVLRVLLREDIKIIPKIETIEGVMRVKEIIKAAKTDTIMLDKDDLYLDCKQSNDKLDAMVDRLDTSCGTKGIKILQLKGVIFHD